jgi:hypothetical protein
MRPNAVYSPLRSFIFLLFLAQAVLAQQPTPIVPDPKLTPGDAFEVTVQDICVPGSARKVRGGVPGMDFGRQK